ncbi:Uncharacterised protein [Klebsiella pneumoniae]|nr:Uncharacterised protein [Klebsiella pneumoniae]
MALCPRQCPAGAGERRGQPLQRLSPGPVQGHPTAARQGRAETRRLQHQFAPGQAAGQARQPRRGRYHPGPGQAGSGARRSPQPGPGGLGRAREGRPARLAETVRRLHSAATQDACTQAGGKHRSRRCPNRRGEDHQRTGNRRCRQGSRDSLGRSEQGQAGGEGRQRRRDGKGNGRQRVRQGRGRRCRQGSQARDEQGSEDRQGNRAGNGQDCGNRQGGQRFSATARRHCKDASAGKYESLRGDACQALAHRPARRPVARLQGAPGGSPAGHRGPAGSRPAGPRPAERRQPRQDPLRPQAQDRPRQPRPGPGQRPGGARPGQRQAQGQYPRHRPARGPGLHLAVHPPGTAQRLPWQRAGGRPEERRAAGFQRRRQRRSQPVAYPGYHQGPRLRQMDQTDPQRPRLPARGQPVDPERVLRGALRPLHHQRRSQHQRQRADHPATG